MWATKPVPSAVRLHADLQCTILGSRAPSTIRTYTHSFHGFLKFCASHGFCPLPADPYNVALFLQHRLSTAQSASVVSQALYSIQWAHSLSSLPGPSAHPLCKQVVDAANRRFGLCSGAKDAVSSPLLLVLHAECVSSTSIVAWRTFVLSLFMFYGLLRWAEVSTLTANDVEIFDDHLVLILRHAKTDQHKLGNRVPLAATESVLCPVKAFRHYILLAKISLPSSQLLFRNVSGSKLNSKALSYSNHLNLVRTVVRRRTSIEPASIGLHSFRSGGASQLLANGAPTSSIKEFGRWCSDSSMDRYLRRSVQSKLVTSKLMNL